MSYQGSQSLTFFIEAVEPNFLVRVGTGEAFKEGRWTLKVKVTHADKRGDWIKSCRSQR
jgi:hypothetical protein